MRNSIRQALMELKGKPFKSLLIAAVVAVMAVFCGMAAFFGSSVNSFYRSFANLSGYSIVAEIDAYHQLDDWSSVIGKIKEMEHIAGYNNAVKAFALCQPLNFSNVPYEGSDPGPGADMVYISGNIHGEFNDYFRNHLFELVEGEFPAEQDEGIVVARALTEQNHAGIGDTLVLDYNGNHVEFRICGIYEVLQAPRLEVSNGYYEVSANSILFCSYGGYVRLGGRSESHMIAFFVDDYDNMEECSRYIESLMPPEEDTVVNNLIVSQEIQMSEVISLMRRMAVLATGMVFVLCAGVLSLVMLLWLRGHAKMIAIYQTLGQSPFYMLGILLIEILFVTVPAAVLTAGLMYAIISRYSEEMFFGLLDFCQVDYAQKSQAEGVWSFHMDHTLLAGQIALLELIVVVAVLAGGMLMLKKSVRELRRI